ncbi:hypothetical protein O6P43_032351 [Quillaja saponaria]|uniref:Uncharacterized protein n=1 Tax=Quillaja saponaria TaxID=32244 RepID=A0AAD7P586_QUISA|nr:hypothetical protein O6P43_032351 [Quillaja saponaria]
MRKWRRELTLTLAAGQWHQRKKACLWLLASQPLGERWRLSNRASTLLLSSCSLLEGLKSFNCSKVVK